MRTKFRTLLLSAAFALAAVSQATAAWDGDCLLSQADPVVLVSVVERASPETDPMASSGPVANVDDSSAEVTAVASAEIGIALPEDIDLQVAMEMAALAQPTIEAPEASKAAASGGPIAEVETTGSLPMRPFIPHEEIEEASSSDMPTAE